MSFVFFQCDSESGDERVCSSFFITFNISVFTGLNTENKTSILLSNQCHSILIYKLTWLLY